MVFVPNLTGTITKKVWDLNRTTFIVKIVGFCRKENIVKKKKNQKKTLGNLYSPYQKYGDDMNAWFEAYKKDSEKTLEIDGRVYSKIIHRCEFYIREDFTLLVDIEPMETLQIGDVLIDEFGREFEIKAFEMIRYAGGMPEWASIVWGIAITGQSYLIGNYLAKK